MREYDELLALLPTDFNSAGMGSRGIGGRDREGGEAGYPERRQHGQVA